MSHVLVIDDDRAVCATVADAVRRIGHDVFVAHSFEEGLEQSRRRPFMVVLVDVQLPDGNGLALLPLLRQETPCPEVIIMTEQGDPDGAELAIRNGAWDYVQKPAAFENIELTLKRALQYQETKHRQVLPVALKRDNIIGHSRAIKESLDLVAQAALTNANTLITGDTGTGKELFAAAIHDNSSRANRRFVVVDCSALPETLVESVLFGHERGAYTGADRSQSGLIAQAHNGTLFLDEIGELPIHVQKAFLRVIQERRYRPVGGKSELESNFCLIAATNRNLDDMVRRNKFRDDLLYRLRTIEIPLSPLRNHKEDIKALSQHHVAKLCLQYEMATKGFTPEFFSVVEAYDWPGNVRELNQALERALASAGVGPLLYPKDLPMEIRAKMARNAVSEQPSSEDKSSSTHAEETPFPCLGDVRERALRETERDYLYQLMTYTQNDIPKAIQLSGLSRARFYALLKKHGIATSTKTRIRK